MKTLYAIQTLIFTVLGVTTLAAPENLLIIQDSSNSWFEAFKTSFANNSSFVAEAFDTYFNGNGEAEALIYKKAIDSAAVLNDNTGDMKSQLLGSLTAKLSLILQQSKVEVKSNSVVSNIIETFESIDAELSENIFAAWSNFEQNENSKTRKLVNKIKTAFQNFKASSDIDPNVIKQFLDSKHKELLNLKKQSVVSQTSYRANLKFWIYQTLSMIQSFEVFSFAKDSNSILQEYPEIVSVSSADQEFLGEIIGQLLLAKIRPAMEVGNEGVAAQTIVNVIADLPAYCSAIAGVISFCYFMSALPPACYFAIGVATLSTVLLVLRTFENLQ